MTKQEIELLIRMRSEADAALNKLGGGLRAVAEDATKAGAGMDRIAGASQRATPLVDQIDKIVDKFTRDASEATRAAMAYSVAVEQIGGASRLTATQHAEVSRAVDKANSAYKAMGQEAPAHLRVLQRDLDGTSTKMGTVKNIAAGMFAGFTVIGAVEGIRSLATSALAAGGMLTDLSAQTGISASALDRMRLAAAPAGVELTTITTAVSLMSDKLANGDKGAVAAISRMGLSLDTLRQSRPDQAFLDIVAALSKIPDPMQRTAAEFDVFGPRAKEILRLVNAEFVENARHGKGWSEDQIKALDDAGDAWTELGNTAVLWSGRIISAAFSGLGAMKEAALGIGEIVNGTSNAGSGLGPWTGGAKPATIGAPGAVLSASDQQKVAEGLKRVADAWKNIGVAAPKALDDTAKAADRARVPVEKIHEIVLDQAGWDAHVRRLHEAGAAYQQLAVMSAAAAQGLASAAASRATGMQWATQSIGGRDISGLTNAVSAFGFVPTSNQNTIAGRGGGINWGGQGGILSQLPGQLASVFASGGNSRQVGGGIGSLAGGLGGTLAASGLGLAAGSFLGSAIPVIGTLIGGFLGKQLGGLFGPSKNALADRQATANIGQTQAGLISRYGSVENIAGMTQAGAELAAGWGHQGRGGEAAFKAQVKAFEESLQRQSQLKSDLIDKERDLASLEAERAALVESLVPRWDNVKGALDRYGISLDGAGLKVQQLGATETWTSMLNDIQLLERAGVDVGGMLFGMKDEISKLVQESMRLGTEIPANMRPYIEELANSGQLLDANGEKITDLSNLKWGDKVATEADKTNQKIDAMTQGIAEFKDAIDEIVRALRELLPAAAGDAARATQDAWDRNRPRLGFDVEGNRGTGEPTSTVDVPGAANGVLAGGPNGAKFRIFGEREPELGGSVDFMSKVMAKAAQLSGNLFGGQGMRIEVVSVIDGKVAARALSGPIVRNLHERKLLP